MVKWDNVTHAHVVRAMKQYDRLGPDAFFAEHGFGPTTTYDGLGQASLPAESNSGHRL